MASLGAIHKPSPGSPTALSLGNLSEVGITLSEWRALCPGNKCHDCGAGLWLLWLLWLLYEHKTHSPYPLVTCELRFPPP